MFVQIYSRASGKYIQVKRNGVDAGGVNGSQYGKDADLCMCVFNSTIKLSVALSSLISFFCPVLN